MMATLAPVTRIQWEPDEKKKFFEHALDLRRTDPQLPARHLAKLAMQLMPAERRKPSDPVDSALTVEMNRYIKSQLDTSLKKPKKKGKKRYLEARPLPIKRRKRRIVRRPRQMEEVPPMPKSNSSIVSILRASMVMEGGKTKIILPLGGEVTLLLNGMEVRIVADEA